VAEELPAVELEALLVAEEPSNKFETICSLLNRADFAQRRDVAECSSSGRQVAALKCLSKLSQIGGSSLKILLSLLAD
jgi:hypothetical protein